MRNGVVNDGNVDAGMSHCKCVYVYARERTQCGHETHERISVRL